MKNKKWILLMLICLSVGELVAWQRRPVDENRCRREGKTLQRCQKETAEDNAYDFTALLSPSAFKIYEDFTEEQKQMAMDYADGNQMDPNAAVARVSKQIRNR